MRGCDKSPTCGSGDTNHALLACLLVQPFVDAISNGTYQIEADVNLDGSVDLLDVQNFVAILFDG